MFNFSDSAACVLRFSISIFFCSSSALCWFFLKAMWRNQADIQHLAKSVKMAHIQLKGRLWASAGKRVYVKSCGRQKYIKQTKVECLLSSARLFLKVHRFRKRDENIKYFMLICDLLFVFIPKSVKLAKRFARNHECLFLVSLEYIMISRIFRVCVEIKPWACLNTQSVNPPNGWLPFNGLFQVLISYHVAEAACFCLPLMFCLHFPFRRCLLTIKRQ